MGVKSRGVCVQGPSGSNVILPLERVTIDFGNCGTTRRVRVLDGGGECYFMCKVGPRQRRIGFLARGALGRHKVEVGSGRSGRYGRAAEFVLDAETAVRCEDAELNGIYPYFKTMVAHDVAALMCDGKEVEMLQVLGNTRATSIRDHTYAMKAYKWWLKGVRGVPELFLRHQKSDGGIYDFIGSVDDYTYELHGNNFSKAHLKVLDDKQTYFSNLPKEADTPYVAVHSAYLAWQACGDDEWISGLLGQMEKALLFILDSKRWFSKKYGLVCRPFTIDTWDFDFCAFRSEKDSCKTWDEWWHRHVAVLKDEDIYCIMHGDQSGMYQSCRMLAEMFEYFGQNAKAKKWRNVAEQLRCRANKLCWNGRFYRHQFFLKKPRFNCKYDEEVESERLSLSNCHDVNRGLTNHEQAVSIIGEYQRLRKVAAKEGYRGEWISVYPSYKMFSRHRNSEESSGRYVNGGLTGIVAGELAKAAFEHGFEDYGVDLLRRYYRFIRGGSSGKQGDPYGACAGDHIFFDVVKGKTVPCDIGPRGWPVAAVLWAIVEGLGGIEDKHKGYERVRLSPRWAITGAEQGYCCARYAACDGYCAYRWEFSRPKGTMRLELAGSFVSGQCHVLLPEEVESVRRVIVDGKTTEFCTSEVEQSRYVDFDICSGSNVAEIVTF